MSDIQTVFIDFTLGADYATDSLGLLVDDGLQTAVILSLFTDRRANPDDILPSSPNDLRGWWADDYPVVPGDMIGSRRWLLSREKQLQRVLNRVKEYDQEALQWLVDDGVASAVSVDAVIVRPGVLGEYISIFPPATNSPQQFKFESLWSNS